MHEVCIPHSIGTSRMGTARVKEEVGADTKLKCSMKYGNKGMWALQGGIVSNKTKLALRI